jgi:hypothetical protein
MNKEIEIVGDTVSLACYQEISALARLFIFVADEIHASEMKKCDLPAIDAAIRGGWKKENLPYSEIPQLCQVMQRAIEVLTAYETDAESHQHPISGPYWEPEEEEADYSEAAQK